MSNRSVAHRSLPRRTVLMGAVIGLAGCAFKPVAIDRQAMGAVRTVALPTTGFPKSPQVSVINGIGKQFGLVGLISTAVVQGNRSDAVVKLMADHGFDPHAYFQDQLTANLKALGLLLEPEAADGTRHDFVPTGPFPAGVDAALDVYMSSYGFFAFSDSDDSPYRPGVSLGMRLVSARDRSVLMQDQVTNTGIDAPIGKDAGAVPPSFTSFSDVTGNPDLALTALRLALTYAAGTVGSRLS